MMTRQEQVRDAIARHRKRRKRGFFWRPILVTKAQLDQLEERGYLWSHAAWWSQHGSQPQLHLVARPALVSLGVVRNNHFAAKTIKARVPVVFMEHDAGGHVHGASMCDAALSNVCCRGNLLQN